MNLSDYDSKCVRITFGDGGVYDGICKFCNADLCEHGFGRRSAALEIMNALFFADDIEDIEVLEDGGGEFGCFRDAYGKLEELVVGDGSEAICEALEDARLGDIHPEHAARLIRCLADHRNAVDGEADALLSDLALGAKDDVIREAAQGFFASFERTEAPKDFRVISNQVRFGCGYRTVEGRTQYFAWHGVPSRNDDYITTTEITR